MTSDGSRDGGCANGGSASQGHCCGKGSQDWQIGHSHGGRHRHLGGMSGFAGGGQGEWGSGMAGLASETTPGGSWEHRDAHEHDHEHERPVGSGATHGWNFGMHSGKGPKGYQRGDERIREEICECLMHDGAIDASDIEVNVVAGEVTLSGTVDERRMRRYAEELAEHHAGVRDIKNDLRIRKSGEFGAAAAERSAK